MSITRCAAVVLWVAVAALCQISMATGDEIHSGGLAVVQVTTEPELFTIAQYRSLMERDVHRQRATEAVLRKDWPTLKEASLAALQLEKQVYGADYQGDDQTRGGLLVSHLQTGDVHAAVQLLPQAERQKAMQSFANGDIPQEKLAEFMSLQIDIAADNMNADGQDDSAVRRVKRQHDLVVEMKVLDNMPEVSFAMAQVLWKENQLQPAIQHARVAYGNRDKGMTKGVEQKTLAVTIGRFLTGVLERTANTFESRNQWSEAVPLRHEAVAVSREISDGIEPSERALARVLRVIDMTSAERERLAGADTAMQAVWADFGQKKVKEALAGTYEVRQTYKELLGADCDGFAYCTRVAGYLHWNLGEYEMALERLILASELLVDTRGARDQMTREAVKDAFVNAFAATTSSKSPDQLLESVRRLNAFVKETFADQPNLIATASVVLSHTERVTALTLEQRAELLKTDEKIVERDRLFTTGKYADAAVVAQDVLKQLEAILGPDDHLVHDAMFSLANCQTQAGMFDDAEANYRTLIATTDRPPFNRLPDFANRLRWLGGLLQEQSHTKDALSILERAKTAAEAASGRNSAMYAYTLRIQARVLTENLGQPALAMPLLVEAAETLATALGKQHFEYAQALTELGECQRSLLRFHEAEKHLSEALKIREQLPQSDVGQLARNMNALGRVFVDSNQTDKAVKLFCQAIELKERLNAGASDLVAVYTNLIQIYMKTGDRTQADLWLKNLDTARKSVWGENDPRLATDRIILGSALMSDEGGFLRVVSPEVSEFVEQILREASEIRTRAFGESSWQVAEVQQRLGILIVNSGRMADGVKLLLESQRKAAAAGNAAAILHAAILSDLSYSYMKTGDYVRALPVRLTATAQFRELLGDQSPKVANSLLGTAQIYTLVGDNDRAETCVREAMAVFSAVGHQRQKDCYLRLALLYLRSDDLDRAEQYLHFLRQSISPDSANESSLEIATLTALIRLYFARKDYRQVIELADYAGRIQPKEIPDPSTEISLRESVGMARMRLGELDQAETILLSVLSSRIEHPSPDALSNLRTYEALAEIYELRGDSKTAVEWAGKSVELAERHLLSISAVLSERQQLLLRATVRQALDRYISLALRTTPNATELYSMALRWKGGVFLRQRSIRNMLANADPETKALSSELISVNQQLSLSAHGAIEGSSAGWSAGLRHLTDRKEQLESQLAQRDAAFRPVAELNPERATELARRLPKDVILVDYLIYASYPSPSAADTASGANVASDDSASFEPAEHLLMFVVTSDQPITVSDLGPMEIINSDIHKWRSAVTASDAAEFTSVGQRLRKSLWDVVDSQVRNEKTVLISPDGSLSQLAFAALPGRKEGTWLLEDHRMTSVAVPQLLLEEMTSETSAADSLDRGMLLVGNVDFSGSAGQSPTAAASHAAPSRSIEGTRLTWSPLPATQGEVDSIRQLVLQHSAGATVQTLTQAEATESALRHGVPQASWLHIATHGFFADSDIMGQKQLRSATRSLENTVLGRESIPGFDPGLLSGLVLAGANRNPEPDSDDGILTAVEISELDLRHIQMTILSACETGLGESSNGEGVQGLQRSLQLAGCRSVVASLWKVDDKATEILMEQFYRNVWERKLSKSEALRQAQIAMLRKYDLASGSLRGDKRIKPLAKLEEFTTTPPQFWAAFVLSGDWR